MRSSWWRGWHRWRYTPMHTPLPVKRARFFCTRSDLPGLGIYIGATIPAGFHVNLSIWTWFFQFSYVWGE
jgi:hypothetical protein